jgi:hypothetical protein
MAGPTGGPATPGTPRPTGGPAPPGTPRPTGGPAPPGTPRAPRLEPGEHIAPFITRRGRFRRVDPEQSRPLPSAARIVGAIAWALVLAESLRRAWKRSRLLTPTGRDGTLEDPAAE